MRSIAEIFGKKADRTQDNIIVDPMTGEVIPLSEMPDEVINKKILGDGVAILPNSGLVISPVSGTVVAIADSLHAYCILSERGLEILIHIGVDTVQLCGNGFKCHVMQGQQIKRGTSLCHVDLALLESKQIPTHTAILLTNMSEEASLEYQCGFVKQGDTLMKYSNPEKNK